MLDRAWLVAILTFIGGWIAVWLWPGSQGAGIVVYAATGALLCVGVAALLRTASRRLSS